MKVGSVGDKIMAELEAGVPNVAGTDISIRPETLVALAAQQRLLLRNDAQRFMLLIGLAKMRHAADEVKALERQLDKVVLDITHLDQAHPGALAQMKAFETKAIAEGRL